MKREKIDQFFNSLATIKKSKGLTLILFLKDMPDFPYQNFEDLRKDIYQGLCSISKFSFEYNTDLLSLFEESGDELLLTLYTIGLMGLAPIAIFVSCFFVSWWWLLLVPISFFTGMRLSKELYIKILLRAALSEERIFSFLYAHKYIALWKNNKEYFFNT